MNKDKHVLPGEMDTFRYRVKREAANSKRSRFKKNIYGPDNEILSTVDVEIGKEISEDG